MKLIEAAKQREKGQIHRWQHYFEAYDFHFQFKSIKRLLEIGVKDGGSLWMWKKYFPDTEIVGIDYDKKCKQWEGEGIEIYIGDQTDGRFLNKVNEDVGPFDIVIDDGSHKMFDQKFTFALLFPLLNDGGIYVIEDLHTSFWPIWGGGRGVSPDGEDTWDAPGTTIAMLKDFIIDLHGWAKRSDEARNLKIDDPPSWYEKNISSIHFYDSLCFVYKKGHGYNSLGERGQCHV